MPAAWANALGGTRLTTVYYHLVTNDRAPHVRHLYLFRNVAQFEEDLDFFLSRFEPVSLEQILGHLNEKTPLPDNAFHVTFDDGFREVAEVAAPVLKKRGVPATFFLCSAFVDNHDMAHHNKASVVVDALERRKDVNADRILMDILARHGIATANPRQTFLDLEYRHRAVIEEVAAQVGVDLKGFLAEYKPYMTTGQVETLLRQGFTVGSHSIDHPLYSALPLEEQLRQTRQSTAFVQEKFGLSYRAFAFPHGDKKVPSRYFDEIFKKPDVDISFGSEGFLRDSFPRHFHRLTTETIPVSARQTLGRNYARGFYKGLTGGRTIKRS